MPAINVQELTKTYGDQTVVDGVSFSVEEGEIFAILGPNGAGKTTTVESIAGLRTPDAGSIEVFGLDPQRDRTELRGLLGVQLRGEMPHVRGVVLQPQAPSTGFPEARFINVGELRNHGFEVTLRAQPVAKPLLAPAPTALPPAPAGVTLIPSSAP
jgi:ABC-type cobalamin/Fe3+-siderophores transport system ATPase subunit